MCYVLNAGQVCCQHINNLYNKVMRDTKTITAYAQKMLREAKQKLMFKDLRKEVDSGANGTQKYVIKQGVNTGKIATDANKFQ